MPSDAASAILQRAGDDRCGLRRVETHFHTPRVNGGYPRPASAISNFCLQYSDSGHAVDA